MLEAEQIAAGLSEAEREMLLRFDLSTGDDAFLHIKTQDENNALSELLNRGLAVHIRAGYIFGQLTALGIAVRAHLTKGNPDDR